jgi:DNA polymerase III delta prime subunit
VVVSYYGGYVRTNTIHQREKSSSLRTYGDFLEYLSEELALLSLKLLRELRRQQKTDAKECSDSRGLFTSEGEILSLLNWQTRGMPEARDDAQEESAGRAIAQAAGDIAEKLAGSREISDQFPIMKLKRIFGLSSFELDVLIMAIAPEIDRKYERIYAYFNDDLTRKLPTVSLALDILMGSMNERVYGLRSFSPGAPLVHFDLIHFADPPENGPLLTRGVVLNERIRRYIFGDNGLHACLSEIAQLSYIDGFPQGDNVQADIREKLLRFFTEGAEQQGRRMVFWLHGKADEEKKAAVTSLCRNVGLPLLSADLEDILFSADQRAVVRNLFLEAALQSAAIFLRNGDLLSAEDEKARMLKRVLLRTIDEMSWITFIAADALWVPDDSVKEARWYPLELNLPGYHERKRIWTDILGGSAISEEEIGGLSGRFNFNGNKIKNTVLYARQSLNGNELTIRDVYNACRIQSNKRISIYARKVTPCYAWTDIVLPEDKLLQLKEICGYIKHKHIVYFAWGFDKKMALGRGLNILFSGPSGTGKTMAADIIAHEFNLDMYKIDLSSIVSKYIGETEKNLERIFKETSSGNMVLFFDEADALFGKRSEVKDAHDRYANIETGYLLQKMEEHEGIVILATNLGKNMDEAFLRRMHFTVEFPFPDEKQRQLIWKKIFPDGAPLSADVDYSFLSSKLRLAGGNIRNVALTAAFLAAEESSEIEMRHIILAVKREVQKMGRLCVKGDFGKYYELIEREAGSE